MQVTNGVGNLIYDDADGRCFVRTESADGQTFAFIQCLDLGFAHARHDPPLLTRYWGFWDPDDPEGSIKQIMAYGGKWPDLPPEGYVRDQPTVDLDLLQSAAL